MEFAKIYDAKINEELKKYEKLQWEMYYRTLLPERMQQFEQEYTGRPEDKEQAMKQHEAELMAKHTGRIQRLLNQKHERLTVECLGELIDRLETAQHEADRKDNEFNPEDYKEFPVDETSSCEGEAPTLASEIIADQKAEIEKLKAELQKLKNENLDEIDRDKERAMFETGDYINKLKWLIDKFMEHYDFYSTKKMNRDDAFAFAYNKENMCQELLIMCDYACKTQQAFKTLDEMEK